MKLDRLKEILIPPAEPLEISPLDDWEAIERELGTPLPRDYKAFIRTYGTGRIDTFLVVFNPFSANEFLNLIQRGRSELTAFAGVAAEFPEFYPESVFPSPGGILPFAGTDNGDVLYWRTDGNPDEWTVTVFDARGPEHFDFNGSMTDFLAAVLTRSIYCSEFPKSFPHDSPMFEPIEPE